MTEYSTATTNATNMITAIASSDESIIEITLNAVAHENGTAATWILGANEVVVTVTNGVAEKIYTIAVMKS